MSGFWVLKKEKDNENQQIHRERRQILRGSKDWTDDFKMLDCWRLTKCVFWDKLEGSKFINGDDWIWPRKWHKAILRTRWYSQTWMSTERAWVKMTMFYLVPWLGCLSSHLLLHVYGKAQLLCWSWWRTWQWLRWCVSLRDVSLHGLFVPSWCWFCNHMTGPLRC